MEKVRYEVKSIAIAGIPGINITEPVLTEREFFEETVQETGPFEGKFEIINMDPVLIRRLFAKPKWKFITVKLKHQEYARPTYLRLHVPQNWTVNQVKDLQRFAKACYQVVK